MTISICVPVYNCENYIDECLTSILNQTFTNFELLISDDCSTDNTLNILNSYLYDPRVRILKNKKNIGWVKNCNILIKESKHEYYCIIPSDDFIPVNYIEKLYEIIQTDSCISNCFPYIIPLNDSGHGKPFFQKSNSYNSLSNRLNLFAVDHSTAISFRGLVKKSNDLRLLYLNEFIENDVCVDSFQILQHIISGKIVSVNVPYFKRYHEKNTHTKWNHSNKTIFDFYFSAYVLLTNYISDKEYILKFINKAYKNRFPSINLQKNFYVYDYVVMGGGIQGCCVALNLKKQGYSVCIIDKNSDLMQGASANNEGKIHLGFVYANDKTFKTAKKMLTDALNFSNNVEQLLEEKIDWEKIKSKKFLYLVPKTSLLNEQYLDSFLKELEKVYIEMINSDKNLNYLGKRDTKIFKKINIPENYNKEYFECCYETEEYAVCQNTLNKKILNKILEQHIDIICNTNIEMINKKHCYYEIITNKTNIYSRRVVNCLWENKTKFDNFIFEEKKYDTNYRYKCGIISNQIEELKKCYSVTIVNGPFGDFVNFDVIENKYMYFSWYPFSMKGFECSDSSPKDWSVDTLIKSTNDFIDDHQKIFSFLFGIHFNFVDPKIIGGIIVGKGNIDISEKTSELHMRNDVRLEKCDGYVSISTGKYTSAPYNALQKIE
jgi:glycosyltransferase involved in cell wall biosynthesis